MSEQELKPCPFCGGAAAFRLIKFPRNTFQQKVECMVCEAQTPHGLFLDEGDISDDKTVAKAEAMAAERWNHRVNQQP